MDIHNLSGRWSMVTGAASGIGRATALALAQRGSALALCDLDEAGLKDTEAQVRALGCDTLCQRVDVADAAAMASFADAVHARVEAVDLLVNNAGVAIAGRFADTSLEDWRWIVDINLMGVVHGCHAFVPNMVQRGRGGHVVNVASAAGYLAAQTLTAYSTTKFAVVGLSEALRDELAADGIGVTTVCPGIIDTPITRAARMRGPLDRPEVRALMTERYRRRGYTPERVARGILRAVQRGRAVAPISPEAWAMYWMKRFAPRLTSWVVGRGSRAGMRELAQLGRPDQ
jgi:NAD(P)-dependent dehydrogenase (short-subunit alcohol dehydrogenase family)